MSHLAQTVPTYFCGPAVINRAPFWICPGLKVSYMVILYSGKNGWPYLKFLSLLSSTPYHIIFSEITGYCLDNNERWWYLNRTRLLPRRLRNTHSAGSPQGLTNAQNKHSRLCFCRQKMACYSIFLLKWDSLCFSLPLSPQISLIRTNSIIARKLWA